MRATVMLGVGMTFFAMERGLPAAEAPSSPGGFRLRSEASVFAEASTDKTAGTGPRSRIPRRAWSGRTCSPPEADPPSAESSPSETKGKQYE